MVKCGNGLSVPSNYAYDDNDFTKVTPNFAIQQNEQEIMEYISVLNRNNHKKAILEIGLGLYGSTHFLLRHYFEEVVTIENSLERTKSFFKRIEMAKVDFDNTEARSAIIVGNSIDPATPIKLQSHLTKYNITGFDCLFKDGNHTLEYVLGDFSLYYNFVKRGGVIAFHDSLSPMHLSGVPTFLKMLEAAFASFPKIDLNRFEYNMNLGIAFFYKL